MPTVGLFD